jgi:ABC-2 type transport system ATP-binding protein
VRVQALGHRYGDRVALRDVSFTVETGEVFGVLGPNGGGKSTLFRILSTMIPAGLGTVALFGRDPNSEKNAVRRDLGIVFQAPSLDPFLSARENLLHQGHLYGMSGRDLEARMTELLGLFDLADRRNERVSRFSGGLRRRVEIAKSLLHRPRLLILDEPSTGLDPGARRDMWAYLNELRTHSGMTVLFTTHYMDEAEHATRVAVLDQGRLIAVDTPEALKGQLGGDVITIETDEPHALARQIQERFGIESVVLAERLRLERVRGHEFVTTLVEAFPGRIRSISVGKATLEDVFIHLTGHRLEENTTS